MTAGFENRYSALDRIVHRLAMGQLDLQRGLSDLEDRLMAPRFAGVEMEPPVFITALPRAGTTLLLEVVCADPAFVAHTYRQMPFVLCPLMWSRLTAGFQTAGKPRERAHGDGLAVDYDSVEAFEEVIWRAFWPDHYLADRIRPWSAEDRDEDDAFPDFLRRHARKLVALARTRRGSEAPRRYVSKNNANIARLAYLRRRFPEARVLVLFREPFGHATSLVRQHRNFLTTHRRDPFARHYMESIGHFEFGLALRPLDFDGWMRAGQALDPAAPDFWCEYWIAAYSAVLASLGPGLELISYDRLCAAPEAGLATIAERLGVGRDSPMRAAAARFRAPTAHGSDLAPGDAGRGRRARELHERLLAAAAF
jgi:hypothetical protein